MNKKEVSFKADSIIDAKEQPLTKDQKSKTMNVKEMDKKRDISDSDLESKESAEEKALPFLKEYTLQEVKDLLEQYDQIADKDDAEMTPW